MQTFLKNDSIFQNWQWNIRISDTITWILGDSDSIHKLISGYTPENNPSSASSFSSNGSTGPVRLTSIRHATLAAGGTQNTSAESRMEKTEKNTVLHTDTIREYVTELQASERVGEIKWKNPLFSLIIPVMVILALAVYLIKRK